MAPLPAPFVDENDLLFLKLAREIAIDLQPVENILKQYQIEDQQWENIRAHPRFIKYLEAELQAWNGALNTNERTKIKAASMVEEWLCEANARLHDRNEALPAKVELGKLITRIAGMGVDKADVNGGSGERFSVTINLGADAKLKFEKEVTQRVIDVTPTGEP